MRPAPAVRGKIRGLEAMGMNGFNFSFSVGLVAAGPAVLTGPHGQALPAADVNVACHRPPGTALAWAKPLARLVLMPLKASKIKPGLLLPAPVPRRRGPRATVGRRHSDPSRSGSLCVQSQKWMRTRVPSDGGESTAYSGPRSPRSDPPPPSSSVAASE